MTEEDSYEKKSHKDRPPPDWYNETEVVFIGNDVYYTILDKMGDTLIQQLYFWHWCTSRERWIFAGVAKHDLVQAKPLTLSPSLLWPCCGKHGYIREGAWENA